MSMLARFFGLTLLLLALPGAALAQKFTFVAYGDTRTNPLAHAAVIKEIIGLHPEFVLQSGDLVSDGGNPKQWAEFEEITKPLRDAHIAYYPARGNHDLGIYYPRHVTEPFDSGDKVNKLYYAFTRHKKPLCHCGQHGRIPAGQSAVRLAGKRAGAGEKKPLLMSL